MYVHVASIVWLRDRHQKEPAQVEQRVSELGTLDRDCEKVRHSCQDQVHDHGHS